MGITRECFEIYARLIESGYINWGNCSVIEYGAQTIHFEDRPFFSKWAKRIRVSEQLVEPFSAGTPSDQIHKQFGNTYRCIDFYDTEENSDVLKWDLNEIQCPSEHTRSYDLVTNLGTTEHIINQANAFKLMHDLVKVGGVMFNLLPMARPDHGFFNYNPCFFEWMAEANQYKILGMYTSRDLLWYQQQELVPYHGTIPINHEYIFCILRRMSTESFKNPSQSFSNGRIRQLS